MTRTIWTNRTRIFSCLTAAAALVLACEARADIGDPFLPNFQMDWDVSNDGIGPSIYNWNQYGAVPVWGQHVVDGSPQVWTGWRYAGSLAGPNDAWTLDWDCVFSSAGEGVAGGGGGAFVTANIVVTNNSTNTENFQLLMTLPVLNAIVNPVERGSIVGTVTDLTFDDATVSAPSGASIYTSLIDGVDEVPLMVDPFSQSAGGPLQSATVGPEDFGIPNPIPASQDVDTSIGIFLNFDLTAGDSASFTAIFEVIPGPGALPALLLFGLFGTRRRR